MAYLAFNSKPEMSNLLGVDRVRDTRSIWET